MSAILVVDDERSIREFLGIYLRRSGHEVTLADSGENALAALAQGDFDVVVTDLRMPGDLDGLALLREVRSRKLNTEVILVTAHASADTAISAIRDGAYDYLTKPFKVDEIGAVINRALEKQALTRENAALRDRVAGRFRLANLLGRSPQMQKLFELIGKIHSTRTSVLITGESGTGKELVARALHSEGSRADKPFVAVNCGAIPEDLLESELFGHVRGAFTGAVADKSGLFSEAHGGTLFLDEIGELPLGLQVKLLRALQERTIKAVGSTHEEEIDVRVVAATNRDLEDEVARGAFRSDLYYRLNVIEARIAPLRERREDIALLVNHFIARFALEQGKNVSAIAPAAMAKLAAYDFPGNVRELENIIEHAVTMVSDSTIEVDSLPRLRGTSGMGRTASQEIDIPDEGIGLDNVLRDFERELISRALDKAGGVRKRAATLLGITFRSLRYRLDKLGLDVEGNEPPDTSDDTPDQE